MRLESGRTLDVFPLESIPNSDAPVAENWLDVLPPKADVLRPYQREIMTLAAAALREYRRLCVQAPTGAGKTSINC